MRIAGLAVLCAVTLVAPASLLVWMPIVLGVPHLANDVRFLVLPLPRKQLALALAASGALVALKAASLGLAVDVVRIEAAVVGAWLLGALVLEPACRKRALGIALFASALVVGLPLPFVVIAAFAHNFVAVIAWLVVARPARRQVLAFGCTLAGLVLVAAGLGPSISAVTGGDVSPWLTIDGAAAVMFGAAPPGVARALLLGFTFLQGVHYAIWLGWIPASQIVRPRASLVTAGIAFATLAVIGAAFVDPAWTRTTYLALATFHVYLELVVLATRFARGKTP